MDLGISVPLPSYKVDVAFMARKAGELGFDLWIPLSPWHGPLGPPTASTEQRMAEELERIAEAVIREGESESRGVGGSRRLKD
jgi:hypothetical protein